MRHSDDHYDEWVQEFRTGMFRSLVHYRRLALAGPITTTVDLEGLRDLLDLVEEMVNDMEFAPDGE